MYEDSGKLEDTVNFLFVCGVDGSTNKPSPPTLFLAIGEELVIVVSSVCGRSVFAA